MPSMTPATVGGGSANAASTTTKSGLELVPRKGLHPSATLMPHAGSGMSLPSTSTGTMVAA